MTEASTTSPCPTCGGARSPDGACAVCGATLASDGPPRSGPGSPPERIGRYVVQGELGRGGMGVVYKASDPGLGRTVAIKLILDVAGAGPEALQRFAQEARAAAKLRHPGIVALLEVGNHDGQPFLVTDFIAGETFEDALRREPMAPRRVAAVVRQVALALQHAHERGIVHRDVKPQNVLLDEEGAAHLMDFGLARDAATDEQLTQTGQVLGTLHYMAPEQAGGVSARQGPHTDVYALGAVLYRALTHQPVFGGTGRFGIIKQILFDDPQPLRQRVRNVHPDLETIALKCLEKEPQARYASAGEVAGELRRFLDGEAIVARPLGPRERFGRWARRNKALAATLVTSGALVGGLLVAGVVGAAYSYRTIAKNNADLEAALAGEADERKKADAAAKAAKDAKVDAEARRDEAADRLALALREKGVRLAAEARHAEAWAVLAESLKERDSLGTRAALGQARALAPRRLAAARTQGKKLERRGMVAALQPGADGRVVVAVTSGAERAQVEVWRVGGERLASLPIQRGGKDEPLIAAWFSDGRLATTWQDKAIWIWELRGDPPELHKLAELTEGQQHFRHRAVAIHGGRVAVAFGVEAARQFGAKTYQLKGAMVPKPRTLPASFLNGVRGLAFHPTGRLIAASSLDKTVRVWDLGHKLESQVLRGHTNGVNGLSFTGDGTLLASGAGDATVRLWSVSMDVHTMIGEAATVGGHVGGVGPVAFGPGTDHPAARQRSWLLASGSMDHTVRLWRVTRSLDTGALAPVEPLASMEAAGPIEALTFGPGWLAALDLTGVLTTWNLEPVLTRRVLRGHAGDMRSVELSSDDRVIAGAAWNHQDGTDPRIVLWSAEDGRELGVLEGHVGGVTGLAFHPLKPKVLFSAGEDGTVREWDTEAMEQVAVLAEEPLRVRGLATDETGRWLGYGVHRVTLRDLHSGEVRSLDPPLAGQLETLSFGPGGRRLASGDWGREGGEVRLWDIASGASAQPCKDHPNAVLSVAFSPDGRTVASGGRVFDATIRLWDASDSDLRRRLEGHRGAVRDLAFHPTLPLLASASADATIKLWDLRSCEAVATYRGHLGGVRALDFSKDGRRLISGGKDGTVRIWDLEALFLPMDELRPEE